MRSYKYFDHKETTIVDDRLIEGAVIFECVSANRVNADNTFEDIIGANPKKINYISCYVEDLEDVDHIEPGITAEHPIVVMCQECLKPLNERIGHGVRYRHCDKWHDFNFMIGRWYWSTNDYYSGVDQYRGGKEWPEWVYGKNINNEPENEWHTLL